MFTRNRIDSHFDPWRLWDQLHGLHGDLNELWNPPPVVSEAPLNLWSKGDAAILEVELPGRQLEDIHVSVRRNVVTVELSEAADDSAEGATAVRTERRRTPLTRQVRLPFEADTERVDATYEQGVLHINLHQHQSTLPSKITVKSG